MSSTKQDWSQPVEIDDVNLAFPAQVIGKWLPPEDEIPESFPHRGPWHDLIKEWFYMGLSEDTKFVSKEGTAHARAAVRQIKACISSFQPSHQHKEHGAAYLASLFFERVETNGKVFQEAA